jgi:hypothetical protein
VTHDDASDEVRGRGWFTAVFIVNDAETHDFHRFENKFYGSKLDEIFSQLAEYCGRSSHLGPERVLAWAAICDDLGDAVAFLARHVMCSEEIGREGRKLWNVIGKKSH